MRENTLAIHAGYDGNEFGTMAVPIYQTTAYEFRDAEHAANLFELKELGNIYTRLMNPTTDVFEKRFAALEGGAAAVATASGMSAIFYAIANVAEAGDNIIVAKQVYGGTTTLTGHTIRRFGIEARYFDVYEPEELEAMIDERTKLIHFESITNPSVDVADIAEIVRIADRHGVLTCTDNTVATPVICKPIEHGVDVVVHSASKYTTGQGLAIGGIVVEREGLVEKLKGNQRYYHFNEPDPSYHGLVYTDLPLPPFTLRTRLALLRDLGAAPSPFNSWLYIQGLETLPLRMRQHSDSALAIAEFLEAHPKVKKVNYPGLKSDPNYPLVQKYFKKGMASGLLSFEVESREEAQRIADSTKLFKLVVNIGDSKSLITHPASTTHQQLSKEELEAAGVPEGLIRLSVGLEDTEDLIEDLRQALQN
ncbi:O-acetylhomoserine aminocarboxypropyltransferase/cysteine synthase family protein [Nitratifractor salsuginis]|uniref:O-succinylhomoserine sulfhydrylase n=1 Tax=Nitratifractor salsuginis (strain DSM 16511 / JCM 12458 / E9I37-1) TaxID=749222 RepID=E6X0A8_NITSE|nr:O-acetylhomoserine aminocarboxypropyltransferase/cysteine synthase family protein [Nitratifractor salsuginis]ADV45697.1 O-acetylhomoserine sulfhydrolase [Nitratifractor salsuginis DSM 16511]